MEWDFRSGPGGCRFPQQLSSSIPPLFHPSPTFNTKLCLLEKNVHKQSFPVVLLSARAERQRDEKHQSTFLQPSYLLESVHARKKKPRSDVIAAEAQNSHFHLIKTGPRLSGTC